MIELSKIKLVIWDLDDTLWTGTLSEGGCALPNIHRQLLMDLTDAGIVNSICSKNEYEPTKQELIRVGLWDYFVFASINWENKGLRIKNLIDNMALRAINVLFIDDNTFNLQEAKHSSPDLQIATPEVIPEIIEQLQSLEKKDKSHTRLHHYKILEEKATAAETYDSNEAFLYASNIFVTIHKDCLTVVDRLHELLMRSNQLNYTKKRISLEELTSILNDDEYDCGYVTVKDRYGDYGIVGFYANRGGQLEHFLFSCRTMGQMIEQYVYAQLGFPLLDVIGEVRTQLNNYDSPAWINQQIASDTPIFQSNELVCKVLLKGPCDLSNSQSYIRTKEDIVTEFTYIKEDTGQVIDTYNHSIHIRGLKEYSEDDNQQIIRDCAFVDANMLHGTFFTGNYDVIFLSALIESVYPIYQKKNSTIKVVYRKSIDENQDAKFFEQYDYVGYTTPEQYKQFLIDCLKWLPTKTNLCIILGATLPGEQYKNVTASHLALNNVVKELAVDEPRLHYIEVDDFVKNEKDITDGINHYQTRVDYEISQSMIRIINDVTGTDLGNLNKLYIYIDRVIKYLKPKIKSAIANQRRLYTFAQKVYFGISRRKTNIKS